MSGINIQARQRRCESRPGRATVLPGGCASMMNRRPRGGRFNKAFTLIELIIVIALVAIMSAMIIPELRGTYEDALLRSAGRKLIDACSVAQSRAVALNQPHRVRIETGAGKYRVEKRVRGQGVTDFVPAIDAPGAEGELDQRITIRFQYPGTALLPDSTGPPTEDPQPIEPVITFYPDGTADAKELLLQDRQGFRLVLRTNPTTARLRIVDLQAGAE